MSITSGGTRKAGPYSGTDTTTSFPFTFKVFQASDLLVVLTDATKVDTTLTLTTHYTVSLNANQDSNPGGSVNMVAAPPTGYWLTIGSNVPQIQSVTLTNNGGFYPSVINAALDYVTILIQQVSEKVGRALTLPFSAAPTVSAQLPPVSAGSLLGWKQDGSGIANVGATGVGAGGIVASNMAAGATGAALSIDTQVLSKSTPGDADKLPLFDSAAFWALKGLTWANLKATLASVFLLQNNTTLGLVETFADPAGARCRRYYDITSLTGMTYNGATINAEYMTVNNTSISAGTWAGRDVTGPCWAEVMTDAGQRLYYYAASASAGVAPTWVFISGLDLAYGGVSQNSVMPALFKNLKIVASGLTNTNAVVTADKVVLEDSNGNYCGVESLNLTINSTSSGANGLDTGSLAASTWYSVWAIYNPSTGTVAGLFSTSATAPTMPSGYTFKARLGWVRTDGTGNKYLLQTLQYGRRATYVVLASSNVPVQPVMVTGVQGTIAATPTFVAVGISNFIPPTSAKIALAIWGALASQSAIAAPNSSHYGISPTAANCAPLSISCSGTNTDLAESSEFVVESTNVYFASQSANSGLSCLGWEDNL